ncbi:single-stranded DNA-binding protein [Humibacter ginsenosidimutans]|uniref:Single-stranded DNA-binding protein n=1 Tax=Humibacter ginsenosidimutans TaxID=2599293 RepID=A0A5B8M1R7_9MICO|nr:single-stranded DNA-binding protein [Humibacter ginsenosidimutans]QDZ14206.1 single-stranded DNA-binding protein [Humibacter ginsenosidimutans]
MPIHTKESASGFIASDPQLTYSEGGVARFYARFGQRHHRREEDGTFTELEPSFHNMVLFRKSAERAYEQFVKNDSFVAEGYTRTYTYEKDGRQLGGEEFIATTIGHDTARSHYTVNRAPRPDQTIEQDGPTVDRAPAFSAPDRPAATPGVAAIAL